MSLMKEQVSISDIRVIRGQIIFASFCVFRGQYILSPSRHRQSGQKILPNLILTQRIDSKTRKPVLAFVIAVRDRREGIIQMLVSDPDQVAVDELTEAVSVLL